MKIWELRITSEMLIRAYNRVADEIQHTDAPTEADLVLIRSGLRIEHEDMISLHWLRNRVVQLRKGNKLRAQQQ